jgi:hypothetical protein
MTRRHPALNRAVAVLSGAALALALTQAPASAQDAALGLLRGIVVSDATGKPVAGATVSLPAFGVRTTSGPNGSFAFRQPLSTASPFRRIEAIVTAPGFGRWTIRGVPLYPNDTLELNAELTHADSTHVVLTPAERRAKGPAGASPAPVAAPRSTYTFTCSGWNYANVVPQTIKVYVTKDKKSKQYDFAFYARHVLPSEWISTWDADALAAGAIAVKTYGAYRAQSNHAYSSGSGCADITDSTSDQVFDPTWSRVSTDQAVYEALGSTLLRGGKLFLTNYWSGAQDDKCQAVTSGTFAGWMSQWGSQNCAKQGKLWPPIDQVFYKDTAWNNLRQLLLDPDVDSPATYAWDWTGRVTRTQGGAYDGNFLFTLKPASGENVVLRQQRPFLGTTSTTYHSKVAIKCPTTNGGACDVIINVVAIESDGTLHIKSRSVTEARDGKWRVYGFDPAAFGVSHTQVKLSLVTTRTIGVDAAVLIGSYGGA